jgi:hypothetical protein
MSLKRMRKPAVMHTVGHQTPAVQHAIATMGGTRGASSGRRRKKRGGASSATKKRRNSSKKRGGKRKKLVAGSAAAKAWGAKMRRARKGK